MTAPSPAVHPLHHGRPEAAPIDRYPGALVRFAGGDGTVVVLEANHRACVLLDATVEDLAGTGFVDGLAENDTAMLASAVRYPDRAPAEVVLRRGTNPAQVLGVGFQRDLDGSVLAAFCDRTDDSGGVVPDTTADDSTREQMLRTQQELWMLANLDQLTGLPNRTSCYDRLDQALARTRREARSTAVLYCELKNIRQVNYRRGHVGGDALIPRIAERFAASVRETDTVCRFGGDEFVVLCEGFDDVAGIEALSRRLIDIIKSIVEAGDAPATVSLSVGIAIARAGSTRDQLLSSAEAASHQAKLNGRNTYVVADHPA